MKKIFYHHTHIKQHPDTVCPIHQMEHPPVGPGTYGFLVGPGPICTFVFAMVGGIVNTTLLILRKDGYALKTMLHIQYKESLEHANERPIEE